jgi:S1-C subfamily serine protease
MDKPEGVMVQKLVDGGSAASAGIKEGDVILKVDGHEVNQPNELQSYIASKTAGTKVDLTIFRNGNIIDKTVTLKEREEGTTSKPVSLKDNSNNNDNAETSASFDKIGLSVRNLTSSEKSSYNIDNGVMITDVKPFSSAANQLLGKGMVIVDANRKKVDNVKDLEKAFKEKEGSAILLKVQDSQGNTRFVGLEIPKSK